MVGANSLDRFTALLSAPEFSFYGSDRHTRMFSRSTKNYIVAVIFCSMVLISVISLCCRASACITCHPPPLRGFLDEDLQGRLGGFPQGIYKIIIPQECVYVGARVLRYATNVR